MWPFGGRSKRPKLEPWKCSRCGSEPDCPFGLDECGRVFCHSYHRAIEHKDLCQWCVRRLIRENVERNKLRKELAAAVAGGLGVPDPYRGTVADPSAVAQRAWEIAGAIIDIKEEGWRWPER